MNRRQFLAGATALPLAAYQQRRPRIAALSTTYHVRSHSDNFITRFLEGYWINERYYPTPCDIVSLYLDQVHPAEIGYRLSTAYGFPVVKSIAKNEPWVRPVFAGDGDRAEHEHFVQAQRLEDYPFVLSAELGMTFRIGKLPYVVLIDEGGAIRAKGLVNTREHLESILQAKQLGIASLQEYLRKADSPN